MDNKISDEGADAFSAAICSGNAPKGFVLDLRKNPQISKKGIEALARAVAYQNKFNNKQITLQHEKTKIIEKAYQDLDEMTFQFYKIDCALNDVLPQIIFYAWHSEETTFSQPTQYPDHIPLSWLDHIRRVLNRYQPNEYKGPVHLITGYPASFFITPYADFRADNTEATPELNSPNLS